LQDVIRLLLQNDLVEGFGKRFLGLQEYIGQGQFPGRSPPGDDMVPGAVAVQVPDLQKAIIRGFAVFSRLLGLAIGSEKKGTGYEKDESPTGNHLKKSFHFFLLFRK
jgi:hypothetical protein